MIGNAKELHVTVCSDRSIRVQQTPVTGLDFEHPSLKLTELQQQTIEVLTDMLRQNRLIEHKEFQVLGYNLYNVLFDNKIGKELTDFLQGGYYDQTPSFLRIKLTFEDQQSYLESWPWEYLFCPSIRTFLSMRTDVVLTRYKGLPNTTKALPLRVNKPQITVLFIAASPKGLDAVQYNGVLQALEDITQQPNLEGRIEVKTLITPYAAYHEEPSQQLATEQELVSMLREYSPDIVHFIGHGRYKADGGELAFAKTNGEADWLHETRLANWLGQHHSVRLVFLQACETAPSQSQNPHVISGVAYHLASLNIPAIIAMKYSVDNYSSNVFAKHFYGSLARGRDVDAAVQEAREQVVLKFNDNRSYAFGLPTLYLRDTGGLLAPVTDLQVVKSRKKKKA